MAPKNPRAPRKSKAAAAKAAVAATRDLGAYAVTATAPDSPGAEIVAGLEAMLAEDGVLSPHASTSKERDGPFRRRKEGGRRECSRRPPRGPPGASGARLVFRCVCVCVCVHGGDGDDTDGDADVDDRDGAA